MTLFLPRTRERPRRLLPQLHITYRHMSILSDYCREPGVKYLGKVGMNKGLVFPGRTPDSVLGLPSGSGVDKPHPRFTKDSDFGEASTEKEEVGNRPTLFHSLNPVTDCCWSESFTRPLSLPPSRRWD